MEKRSLTLDPSKPPLFAFECPLDILIEPLSTPIMGISLPLEKIDTEKIFS